MTNITDNKNQYILNSLDNALLLLNLFFDYEELSTIDAAKLLGISRSTAFRFMVTLENRGFLTKTSHSTYRLGLNMFSLGMLAYNRMELATLVHPYLLRIAEQTGETCHMAILDDGIHVMFIDRALGTSQLKMETVLGFRQIAHYTATGKAILAYQSEQFLNQYIKKSTFKKLTATSIENASELLHVIDTIKVDGYACDNEESESGLTCYAVPLLDTAGRPVAAISISGPTTRMEKNKMAHIKKLREVIDNISKTIK